MIRIWAERIYALNAYRTGTLVKSLMGLRLKADPDFTKVELSQEFEEYGIYVNDGTGKETKKGNPGDIGRQKLRKAKKWFYPKYYMSYRNIQEFFADSLGQQAAAIISNALDPDELRKNIRPKNKS